LAQRVREIHFASQRAGTITYCSPVQGEEILNKKEQGSFFSASLITLAHWADGYGACSQVGGLQVRSLFEGHVFHFYFPPFSQQQGAAARSSLWQKFFHQRCRRYSDVRLQIRW
jgi:hypothetical protein